MASLRHIGTGTRKLENLKKNLNSDLQFQKYFKVDQSKTITGRDESRFVYIAANYLRGIRSFIGLSKSALIEMGGSSVQIAVPRKAGLNIPFLQSFPGLGANSAHTKFLEYFANTHHSSAADSVENPCRMDEGGDGVFHHCYKGILESFIDDFNTPEMKNSRIELSNSDKYSMKDLNFFGLEVFYYNANKYGLDGKEFSFPLFKEQAKILCDYDTQKLDQYFTNNGLYKGHDNYYRKVMCFRSVYILAFLEHGLGLNLNEGEDDSFHMEPIRKINGRKVRWTFGAFLNYKKYV